MKIKLLKVVLFTCAIQIKFTFGNMPYIKQVFLVCVLNSHKLFDGRMSICNKFCDLQMPFQEVDGTLQPFQLHVCGSFNLITLKYSYTCYIIENTDMKRSSFYTITCNKIQFMHNSFPLYED